MRLRLTIAALAVGSVATAAHAQHHHGKAHTPSPQPYAGQETRVVASLSEEDLNGFLDGRGMGLARAAELNGHPGPMHVLELADALGLTPEQRVAVQAAFERMKAKARALGEAYVAAEKAVDAAFKPGIADAAEVAARVAEANRLLGEVRLAHLQAHVEITPLLTPEQRARYAALRGYAASGADDVPHQPRHGHEHKH